MCLKVAQAAFGVVGLGYEEGSRQAGRAGRAGRNGRRQDLCQGARRHRALLLCEGLLLLLPQHQRFLGLVRGAARALAAAAVASQYVWTRTDVT